MSKQTEKIVSIAREYGDNVKAYKQFAENRRNQQKYTQPLLWDLYNKALAYFGKCREEEKPLTIGKFTIALGIAKSDLYKMKNGEMDYRLAEYMDVNDICVDDVMQKEDYLFNGHCPLEYHVNEEGQEVLLMTYSEIMGKCCAIIEAENEERLLEGNKPVGSIFYLKSVFNYSDTPEQAPLESKHVIATMEEADKLTEMGINEEAERRAFLLLEAERIEKRTQEKLQELRMDNVE